MNSSMEPDLAANSLQETLSPHSQQQEKTDVKSTSGSASWTIDFSPPSTSLAEAVAAAGRRPRGDSPSQNIKSVKKKKKKKEKTQLYTPMDSKVPC
jgi:hypothetical protein